MYSKSNRRKSVNQRYRTNFAQGFKASEPELFQMISYVRRNGEVKRHVSLAIINMMKQKGLIGQDSKVYIRFLLNRFSVKVNGLATEFNYTEEMFIKALLASCMSVATYVQVMVSEYLKEYEKITIDESKYNTKEGKTELSNIALDIFTHISDKNVIIEEPSDENADGANKE